MPRTIWAEPQRSTGKRSDVHDAPLMTAMTRITRFPSSTWHGRQKATPICAASLSLASVEEPRSDTLYTGTAGGIGPGTIAGLQPERRRMMLKQGPSTPAIEGADRGYLRRCAIELPAQAIEDFRRNALHRIEARFRSS